MEQTQVWLDLLQLLDYYNLCSRCGASFHQRCCTYNKNGFIIFNFVEKKEYSKILQNPKNINHLPLITKGRKPI